MIKKIDKVYCSLNLGFVYNLNYSFSQKEGVKITLFFVNESGRYDTDKINSSSRKELIRIGNAAFNLYPVSYSKATSGTSSTIKVDFIDDNFQLDNYYIALTGRGCGEGVFQLGTQVDNRTDAEKEREDPDLFKIKKFTSFEDIEYSFNDFINVLKRVFNVKLNVSTSNTVTRPFTGTFRSVLDAWCSYYNFSYFFENSALVIFDPTSLNISFPSIPSDAIDSDYSESIENTYNKTVWSVFQSDGDEVSLSAGDTENVYISNETLFPWENIFDVKNINEQIDMEQVAAAQYGEAFWFLYNFQKGTEYQECGFEKYKASSRAFLNYVSQEDRERIKNSIGDDKEIAFISEDVFQRNYLKYKNYGTNVAGRYYVSTQKNGFESFNLFEWYDQNTSKSLTIDALKASPRVDLRQFKNPSGQTKGVIPDTIAEGYEGLKLSGQRFYVVDNFERDFESVFSLNDGQKSEITGYYNKIFSGNFGSEFIDWTSGSPRTFVIYENVSVSSSQVIMGIINEIKRTSSRQRSIFNYRYPSNFQVKGFFDKERITADANSIFDTTDIQIGVSGGTNVSSNTSTIKAKKNSDYVVFYSKYEKCFSESSVNKSVLKRRFQSVGQSLDFPIPVSVQKRSNSVIRINRDTSLVEAFGKSGILKKQASPFDIPEKRMSFTLNYFYEGIPTSFLSNGLVGISISFSESGMTAIYSYSNEMLNVEPSEQLIEQMERSIKSSWIRNYNPQRGTQI